MDPPSHWSVRAEFHITHPGLNDPRNPAKTDTVQDESGIKMSYSWDPSGETHASNEDPEPAAGYTFQRGNICFSSTPPPRKCPPPTAPPPSLLQVPESSGYGSDLLSPSSRGSSVKGREQQTSVGRKCRSTCNIVLSANVQGLEPPRSHCGRTQSLRCQTPSACCERRSNTFYGCGDPWCHHLHYGDDFSRRISPVKEMCEDAKPEESYAPSEARTSAFGDAPKPYDCSVNRNCDSYTSRVKSECQACSHISRKEHDVAAQYVDCRTKDSECNRNCGHCAINNSDSPASLASDVVRPLVRTVDSAQLPPYAPDFKPIENSAKKDVSVQTYSMVNKCTSPLLKSEDSFDQSPKPLHRRGDKLKRGKTIGSPRSSKSPSSSVASGNLRNLQRALPKLSRSPTSKNVSNESCNKTSPASDGKSSDSSKKPRTIHIDVYCTGTEIESDSSDSSESSRSKTASTPQTVFESDKVCVTHKQAGSDKLPYVLKQKLQTDSFSNSTSLEKEDSDVDDASTAYPSKLSSYSNMGCSLSSMSSFPNSMASCTMSNSTFPDFDTSWKDTFSDVASLLNSRSSIGQTDSVYFVPKKIEEEVEEKELSPKPSDTGTTNSVTLLPSDSFEYANSEDRLRIKRMERLWKNKTNSIPHPKFSMLKRKISQDQQSLQDSVNLRLKQMNQSKDSDSELSDEDEKGWMFVKSDEKSVTSGGTAETQIDVSTVINKAPVSSDISENLFAASRTYPEIMNDNKTIFDIKTLQMSKESEKSDGNLSDSNSSPGKSPSSAILQERLKLNPHLLSPFTIVPGHYTEPRMIAKRFGAVVEAFKKPGHHVGPAKNPSCLCDHCRRHFENSSYRNRACSLDSDRVRNWKDIDDEEKRRRTLTDI